MVDINNCGLYVVINNVEQFKKTFSIINILKSAQKEITLKFITEEKDGIVNNYMRIDESGIKNSIEIYVQHKLFSDSEKFKCLNDPKYKGAFNTVCVDSKSLCEIFKGLNNTFNVIFFIDKMDTSNLGIHITNNSTFLRDFPLQILTPNIDDDTDNINDYPFKCCAMLGTKALNENIKFYNKFTDNIKICCTINSLTFESVGKNSFGSQSIKTVLKGTSDEKQVENGYIYITPGSDIEDPDMMIVESTYAVAHLNIVSKIDEQFCNSVFMMFVETKINNNYVIIFDYSYSNDEFIKIIVAPINIKTNETNNDQLNY